MKMFIQVQYSCGECGIHRRGVLVRAREAEDVIVWTEHVMTPAIMKDHQATSPLCHPQTITEVRVPVTGASKVGGAPEN